jgi:hypothetical protein
LVLEVYMKRDIMLNQNKLSILEWNASPPRLHIS